MSERQAKRLRRATRAYIRANKTSLAKGDPARDQAYTRAAIVRELWPRLNHRGRGVVGARLEGDRASDYPRRSAGGHWYKIPPSLNGALRALGVAVPS